MLPGLPETLSLADVGGAQVTVSLQTWLCWSESLHPLDSHRCPQTQQDKILRFVPLDSLHVHPLESRPAGKEGSGKPPPTLCVGWGGVI